MKKTNSNKTMDTTGLILLSLLVIIVALSFYTHYKQVDNLIGIINDLNDLNCHHEHTTWIQVPSFVEGEDTLYCVCQDCGDTIKTIYYTRQDHLLPNIINQVFPQGQDSENYRQTFNSRGEVVKIDQIP